MKERKYGEGGLFEKIRSPVEDAHPPGVRRYAVQSHVKYATRVTD